MAIAKRVFLFILTNLLIITLVNIIVSALGLGPQMTSAGINYTSLAVFCLVWGMVGSFLSLALSRFMAKRMTSMRIINLATETNSQLRDVAQMVHKLATQAGLPKMPEVGVYESTEVNAFATGPTKARSLVGVSTGLLNRMNRDEVEGVIGHEIAHIANGDMVTMTLLQGVINAFVLFLSRIIAFAVANAMKGDREGAMNHGIFMITSIFFQIIFGMLGAIVVAWFSRWREFRADIGGAKLAGRSKMISALSSLAKTVNVVDPRVADAQASLASFKISGKGGGLRALFASHPPLEVRIERLKQAQIV